MKLIRFPKERIAGLVVGHAIPKEKTKKYPVVLIHGMWAGYWYFLRWIISLANDGYEVYAVNLRGHHDENFVGNVGNISMIDYIEDVSNLLKVIGPAYVIGHSMGGLIAQALTERCPQVRKAIFLTPAPPRGIRLRGKILLKMLKWGYLKGMIFNKPVMITDEDNLEIVLNNVTEPRRATTKFTQESGRAAREMAIGVKVAKINCPAVVIGAMKDKITPIAIARKIARRYGIEMMILPGAHMPMLEHGQEESLTLIKSWLEK